LFFFFFSFALSIIFSFAGVISPKTGVPQGLFVLILTDGTKKTLSCTADENALALMTFLKRKRDANNFIDDFNVALDSKGLEIPADVLVKEVAGRCAVLEKKEAASDPGTLGIEDEKNADFACCTHSDFACCTHSDFACCSHSQ
jgi:hypothetical protein